MKTLCVCPTGRPQWAERMHYWHHVAERSTTSSPWQEDGVKLMEMYRLNAKLFCLSRSVMWKQTGSFFWMSPSERVTSLWNTVCLAKDKSNEVSQPSSNILYLSKFHWHREVRLQIVSHSHFIGQYVTLSILYEYVSHISDYYNVSHSFTFI